MDLAVYALSATHPRAEPAALAGPDCAQKFAASVLTRLRVCRQRSDGTVVRVRAQAVNTAKNSSRPRTRLLSPELSLRTRLVGFCCNSLSVQHCPDAQTQSVFRAEQKVIADTAARAQLGYTYTNNQSRRPEATRRERTRARPSNSSLLLPATAFEPGSAFAPRLAARARHALASPGAGPRLALLDPHLLVLHGLLAGGDVGVALRDLVRDCLLDCRLAVRPTGSARMRERQVSSRQCRWGGCGAL